MSRFDQESANFAQALDRDFSIQGGALDFAQEVEQPTIHAVEKRRRKSFADLSIQQLIGGGYRPGHWIGTSGKICGKHAHTAIHFWSRA